MFIVTLIVSRWQWSQSVHEGSWRLWQWCELCQGLISSYLLLFFLPLIVACSTTTGKTLGVQLLTWQTIASLLLQLSSDFLQSSDNNLTPSMLVLQVIFGKIFVSHNNKLIAYQCWPMVERAGVVEIAASTVWWFHSERANGCRPWVCWNCGRKWEGCGTFGCWGLRCSGAWDFLSPLWWMQRGFLQLMFQHEIFCNSTW